MRLHGKSTPKSADVCSSDYPLGKAGVPSNDDRMMSLLALSHTPTEHELYVAMLAQTRESHSRKVAFSLRRLMELTELTSYSAVRRSLQGLLRKLSIESHAASDGEGRGAGATFFIYYPEEIFARRLTSGLAPFPKEAEGCEKSSSYSLAIKRIIQNQNLSRREAQVALLCTRGLTNAEIGERLRVSEQTIKFHLRHIFIKFGVRRRAELISRLLMNNELPEGDDAQYI
jgi:DNA-binding CsgD family transcriptional regulator